MTYFAADDQKSVEERELEEKIAQLNKQLARAAEELSRATQISSDAEHAAAESALSAERARQDAQRIQVRARNMYRGKYSIFCICSMYLLKYCKSTVAF